MTKQKKLKITAKNDVSKHKIRRKGQVMLMKFNQKYFKLVTSLVLAFVLSCTGMMPDSSNVLNNSNATIIKAASQAQAIVDYALSQVGTKERSAGSDDIIYNDFFYGHRVSNRYSGQYAWCHAFLFYCAQKCGINDSIFPKTASCQTGLNFFRNQGRYYTRSSGYTPQTGDIVYFSTDGSSTAHHVGIIYAVDSNRIYYVDGNNVSMQPHGVAKSSKARSNASILGYAKPDYSNTKTPPTWNSEPSNNASYSIDNVKITEISSDQISFSWDTTNLPMCAVLVSCSNGNSWRSNNTLGNVNQVKNSFNATFNKSSILNCLNTVKISIYAYSSSSGGNETLHNITYGSSIGSVTFPTKNEITWSESVPDNMLSHGLFSGWIVSDEGQVSSIKITINGTTRSAQLTKRDDVKKAYPDYKYAIGYSMNVTPYYVNDGANSYNIEVQYSNGEKHIIKNGTFQAMKNNWIYDDAFFKAKYADNINVKNCRNSAEREEFFYENLNKKVNGEYLTGSIVCDLNYYYNANPDLRKNGITTGYQIYDHFIKYALKSGKEYRAVSPWVSLSYLHGTYSDLKNMAPEQLFIWAATYGAKIDGRLLNNTNEGKAFHQFYQVNQYAKLNTDLIKKYGEPFLSDNFQQMNCSAYWNHIWLYGINDRRSSSDNFNIAAYCKNANLDQSTSGWNIFNHYCSIGYKKRIKTK